MGLVYKRDHCIVYVFYSSLKILRKKMNNRMNSTVFLFGKGSLKIIVSVNGRLSK